MEHSREIVGAVIGNFVISCRALVLLKHANVIIYKNWVGFDAFISRNEGAQILKGSHFDPLLSVLREFLEDLNQNSILDFYWAYHRNLGKHLNSRTTHTPDLVMRKLLIDRKEDPQEDISAKDF